MPINLKLLALTLTALGLFVAIELARLTSKQFKKAPSLTSHHFSNMLGFFPTTLHRIAPYASLALGQAIAAQNVDQA